jgi:hypothetical protein
VAFALRELASLTTHPDVARALLEHADEAASAEAAPAPAPALGRSPSLLLSPSAVGAAHILRLFPVLVDCVALNDEDLKAQLIVLLHMAGKALRLE